MNRIIDAPLPLNAVEFLRIEHRRLAQLGGDLLAAQSDERRIDLIPFISRAVRLHYELEASIFIPQLSQATGDGELLRTAAREYSRTMTLVDELEYADLGGNDLLARVYSLSKLIADHIKAAEEPAGLFDRAVFSLIDCETVGDLLGERARELTQQSHFGGIQIGTTIPIRDCDDVRDPVPRFNGPTPAFA